MKDRNLASVSVYENDYRLKLQGVKGILNPSEDLIRLLSRASLMNPTGDRLALDYGVGDGRHSNYLSSLGYSVVGTDIAPSAVELVNKFMAGNEKFKGVLLKSSDELPFPDHYFSLIVAWEVLHWIGHPDLFLKVMHELLRLMRPEGLMLLTMPTEKHYLKRFSLEVDRSTYLCKLKSRSDCVFYSPNLFTLTNLFEKELGLGIKHILRYEYGSTSTENSLDDLFSMYGFCLGPVNQK
jgi:SAM-dependent methyltransferase